MERFEQLINAFSEKMQDRAAIEALYMRGRRWYWIPWKLRLIVYAIAFISVGLMALWMARHP